MADELPEENNNDISQPEERSKGDKDIYYKMHAEFCKLFGHPKRLQVMDLLRYGEKQAGELCEELQINPANLSQHLSLLKRAGAIVDRREGNTIFYRLTHKKILEAVDIIQGVIKDILSEKQDQMSGPFE